MINIELDIEDKISNINVNVNSDLRFKTINPILLDEPVMEPLWVDINENIHLTIIFDMKYGKYKR